MKSNLTPFAIVVMAIIIAAAAIAVATTAISLHHWHQTEQRAARPELYPPAVRPAGPDQEGGAK